MARLAALLESDVKKIVALSTLSQLRLMLVSLFLGNKEVMLFHLVAHAVAKANLFIVVGAVLHRAFSIQNLRNLRTAIVNTLRMRAIIRILSLRGLRFYSGIISKEEILKGHYYLASRILSLLFISILVLLTLAYCAKLIASLGVNHKGVFYSEALRISELTPVFFISRLIILLGVSLSRNMFLLRLTINALRIFFFLGVLVLFALNIPLILQRGFYFHETLTKGISFVSPLVMNASKVFLGRFTEPVILYFIAC
jgi:NADH:ubiquinone oxidoreductase subunit 5 (subunit L)/multisubunit Na+/H+ antiporter MnhA subunit